MRAAETTDAAPADRASARARKWAPVIVFGAAVVVGLVSIAAAPATEPCFNNDETRHVMSGVFARDFLRDLPLSAPVAYAVRYYLQYPALGFLVWPPLHYAVEGLWMSLFGASFLAARVLIVVESAIACALLLRIIARDHDLRTALLTVALFRLTPLVFDHSRVVMLEVPTLMLALASIDAFLSYLDGRRPRDIWVAAIAAALTFLTRYDGAFLLPFFAIVLVSRRRLSELLRGHALGAMVLALALVVPYVLVTAQLYGSGIATAAARGTVPDHTTPRELAHWLAYPRLLVAQLGPVVLAPALLGLGLSLAPTRRARSLPFLALVAATYLTFTPLAEIDARHAIYWVPAFCFFATQGLLWVGGRLPGKWAGPTLTLAVVGLTGWNAFARPAVFVRGYETAARHVVAQTRTAPVCLLDSYLNGDFIFQVRRLDPGRRFWVLRADKLLYGMVSEPHGGYREYVRDEADVLEVIDRHDPEWVVVEEPQVRFRLAAGELLRDALRRHPGRFQVEARVPIESGIGAFAGTELVVYRNLSVKGRTGQRLEVEMLNLGRSLETRMGP